MVILREELDGQIKQERREIIEQKLENLEKIKMKHAKLFGNKKPSNLIFGLTQNFPKMGPSENQLLESVDEEQEAHENYQAHNGNKMS